MIRYLFVAAVCVGSVGPALADGFIVQGQVVNRSFPNEPVTGGGAFLHLEGHRAELGGPRDLPVDLRVTGNRTTFRTELSTDFRDAKAEVSYQHNDYRQISSLGFDLVQNRTPYEGVIYVLHRHNLAEQDKTKALELLARQDADSLGSAVAAAEKAAQLRGDLNDHLLLVRALAERAALPGGPHRQAAADHYRTLASQVAPGLDAPSAWTLLNAMAARLEQFSNDEAMMLELALRLTEQALERFEKGGIDTPIGYSKAEAVQRRYQLLLRLEDPEAAASVIADYFAQSSADLPRRAVRSLLSEWLTAVETITGRATASPQYAQRIDFSGDLREMWRTFYGYLAQHRHQFRWGQSQKSRDLERAFQAGALLFGDP